MNVLIAPDSFKECLSAAEVAKALAHGWRTARPGDTVTELPIADGGEGFVAAMLAATGGIEHSARVSGPLGAPVVAAFGVSGDGRTAFVEMAAASGLALVPPAQRDVLRATTRGTGELLLAAARIPGVQQVVLGIGGSATNDGGAGFAAALGWRFLDADGEALPPGGAPLAHLAQVVAPPVPPTLPALLVACDVKNPLCGPNGASHVYGPQKGATPAQATQLDAALQHYAELVEGMIGRALRDSPGAGAAGGLGFGLLAFANAELRPGLDVVSDLTGLEARIASCDLILTGEGRADAQSLMGKVIGGLCALAKRHGKPVAVVAGDLGPGHEALHAAGVVFLEQLGPAGASEAERKVHAPQYLAEAAASVAGRYPLP